MEARYQEEKRQTNEPEKPNQEQSGMENKGFINNLVTVYFIFTHSLRLNMVLCGRTLGSTDGGTAALHFTPLNNEQRTML